jgi:K(+)-stimulated pyrophosphate-energized sodium pump
MYDKDGKFIGKGCDMDKCATMTKEECAKMCEDNKCSPEQKAKCMSMYDKDGKYIGPKK